MNKQNPFKTALGIADAGKHWEAAGGHRAAVLVDRFIILRENRRMDTLDFTTSTAAYGQLQSGCAAAVMGCPLELLFLVLRGCREAATAKASGVEHGTRCAFPGEKVAQDNQMAALNGS